MFRQLLIRSYHVTSVMHAPKPSALIPGSLSALSFNPNKSNPSPNRSGSAEQIVRVIEDLGEQQLEEQDPNSDPSLLQNLRVNSFISPRHLSPQSLLTPYPPKASLERAYPLGIPKHLVPSTDIFSHLSISPLSPSSALNPYIVSSFVTEMGKIKPRGKTMLGRKNQRMIGKAVRRARSMGIIPTFGVRTPGY